jgi:hypothetical protein
MAEGNQEYVVLICESCGRSRSLRLSEYERITKRSVILCQNIFKSGGRKRTCQGTMHEKSEYHGNIPAVRKH